MFFLLIVTSPVLGFEPRNADVNSGWETDTQQLDEIIDELEESIQRAINVNAAHPGFIETLQDSLQKLKIYRDNIADSGSPNYSWSTPFDLRLQFNSPSFNWSLGGFADRSGENTLSFKQPIGKGSMVVCLTAFGQVEEVSVYRAKTPISTSELYAQSRVKTTNAMYEIRADMDSNYRILFVELVVRKKNGDLERLTFSTLADDIRALSNARPVFVD